MLRGVHDGAHADVRTASRFLEGKETFGLSLGFIQVWQAPGCRPGSDIHGGDYMAFDPQQRFLKHQLHHCWTWSSAKVRAEKQHLKLLKVFAPLSWGEEGLCG